jgi:hypothetical protein
MTLMLILQLSSAILLLEGTPWWQCFALLNGEDDSAKDKQSFTSSTLNTNFLQNVHSMRYFCTQSSNPTAAGIILKRLFFVTEAYLGLCLYTLFSMFWATVLTLQISSYFWCTWTFEWSCFLSVKTYMVHFYKEVLNFVDQFTALRFTVTSAPPAVIRIQILPKNQYAC